MAETLNETLEGEGKKKRVLHSPHVYVLLIAMVVVCSILSYILPAGTYDMKELADGRMVVDADTFKFIPRTPVLPFGIFTAIPEGMVEIAQIIFFIFIVGGSFYVMNATGAIEAGLGKLTKIFGGKERLVIPIVMAVLSACGAIFGMAEETLPFIPIMVTLAIALGFDSITGAAMVFIGACSGFTAAFMNPFTVGVAQGIVELPIFSGMGFRIILYVCMMALTITYVMIYAGKVKKDPKKSLMYEYDKTRTDVMDLKNLPELTVRRKIILLILVATIIMLMIGVMKLGWYLNELAALFLIMGFASGLIGGLGLNGSAEKLAEGMAGITGGALVVGFARAILVVLTKGNIIHTILHAIAVALRRLHPMVGLFLMYVFQCLISYIIPSGSGQASVTMPIMGPLAQLIGITQQTTVVAFQLADGISNIFTPTSGFFMAGLALARIPWEKWAKWFLPLMGMQYLLGFIFIVIAQLIHLGPF